MTPAGELPPAVTSTGEDKVALLAGLQIWTARLAGPGFAQLGKEVVLIKACHPEPIQLEIPRSWRESRLKARSTRAGLSLVFRGCSVPDVVAPFPVALTTP